MSEPFLGEIRMFAGNFAPRGWALCDGQLLPIANYTSLFSILGTTYGGDGLTTFGLPELRGRVPIHPGNGPGLSSYSLGQQGGVESTSHAHAASSDFHGHELIGASPGSGIAQTTVSPNGGDQSATLSMLQPYLAVNFIIAIDGLFPSRS